ncbi:MAG: glutamyl-tRNA amidotransferase [Nitrospirae bacterium GWD2_57_9]|nr:MAG: glutamyl-tRNA amidotransferase [Nitrospirae bacterium GWD2_57_9]OGW50340.1 MAG: glutamyl-tRNA amidotransferase [Nitrospirae bacterium GWC2_57_9]
MGLRENIDSNLKEAMKSGAKDKVSTLRMLNAALKNKQIDKRRPLTDEEVIETVRSLIKQRKDSIEQFAKGGRQDLVDKETAEVGVLEEYLPQQLSREEVDAKIRTVIAETGAQGPKDMGKVMKALIPVLGGRADGKLVSELVKNALGQ